MRVQYGCAVFFYGVFNFLLRRFERVLFRRFFRDPQTILIFRTGYLGDTLCAIPAMKGVQRQFPKARLLFMTNLVTGQFPFPKDVLEKIIEFDEVIAYDPARIYESGYLKTINADLKRKKIDLLVYLGQSNASFLKLLRDMIFFRIAGCKSACGFRVNAHRIFALAQRAHRSFDTESLRLMKLVEPLGIAPDMTWSLPQMPFDAASRLDHSDKPVIAIHPSAKYAVKRWPIERFIQVAKHLQSHDNALIVIIGGMDTKAEAESLLKTLEKDRALDLTGQTSFLETAEVLRRCNFLLSNDSGPVHIAAAVNTPVVGIYSARDFPNAWYPWGKEHHVFRKDVDCQICFLEECPVMTCIKNITVDEVIAACDQLLEVRQ